MNNRKPLLTLSAVTLLGLLGAAAGTAVAPSTASATQTCDYRACGISDQSCFDTDLTSDCNTYGPTGPKACYTTRC